MRVQFPPYGTQIFVTDGAYRESDYPAPKGFWELKKSWKLHKVYDVTEKVRKSVYEEPDCEVTMASRVWVGGGGEGYFEVESMFKNMKLER